MDSLRYWVTEMHVDGFRFDLASDAGPRVLRRRPARHVLRARAAGPGRQPGQADRRAVGRRPGRLPGRQLPAAVDRVERRLPRHRPRLLARRAVARRVRLAGGRLGRPLRAHRPPAVRQHQLRHRPRRLHAARPGLLQREAQRGQRRGQQRRREPQPVVEPRRRGADRRPARSWRRAPAPQRNFLATLLLSQGVPMLLHGDELGRTQQGNNNTYAQDTELSWVHWDQADQPLVEFTAACIELRRDAPDVPPPAVLHRHHGARRRRRRGRPAQRHRLAAPRRSPDGGRRLGRAAPRRSGCISTATASPAPTLRGEPITDDHFLLYFNADGPAEVTLPPDEYAAAWDVVIDTGGAVDDGEPLRGGGPVAMQRAQRRGAARAHRARGRARPLGRGLAGGPGGPGLSDG